jgi:hypothetical protein
MEWNSPPKPKTCECCGEVPRYWVEDYTREINAFRGWICESCDIGIKLLGDNLQGVMRAVMYLETVGMDAGLRGNVWGYTGEITKKD